MKKAKTILLDLSLVIGVIILPITASTNIHTILGVVFTALLTTHILIKRKWLVAVGRKIRTAEPKQKQKYIVAILMIKVWYIAISAAIFSGFTEENWPIDIHQNFVLIGIVLVIIHLYQNIAKIKMLFTSHPN
ncbi:MAG: hypothetical protein FWF50_07140 [Defluviitaleaceae bacterium]|nr:hypothetical protein [Defluviitaleaceae bacterium]